MRARHSIGRHELRDHRGAVAVTADADTAVTVVSVSGVWGNTLRREAFLALKKSLSEHPAALIFDLNALADARAESVSTWLTTARVAEAMEPPVRVAASVRPGSPLAVQLHRIGATRFLPLFDDVARAGAEVASGGPVIDRRRLALPPHPDTPALARNLVTEACSAWGLSEVLYPARLVMSELAGNAVQHGRTPIGVLVVRRGRGVHLIVSDHDRRMPRLIEASKEPPGNLWDFPGQGLRTVRAASAAWGVLPTREGKMVWATVRPR